MVWTSSTSASVTSPPLAAIATSPLRSVSLLLAELIADSWLSQAPKKVAAAFLTESDLGR